VCYLREPYPWFVVTCLLAGMPAVASSVVEGRAVAPPTTAVVPAPEELLATRAQLLDCVRRGEVPSLAVGVARGEKVVWQEALGWADRESKIPATSETLYPVASVSKSITATGALALVAAGRLRLDQPVDRVLGGVRLRESVEPVRVSHLLAHTSGIPHLWHYEYPDHPETLIAREELIRNSAFVAVPPGERFLYSNLGYGVLAQVIETVGGAPFQKVMAKVLFEPLGMRHTSVEAWTGGTAAVRGYSDGKPIPYRFRLAPDGGAGFFSNLHDLVRYARFHLGMLEAAAPARDASIVAALDRLPREKHYLRGWGVVRLSGATVLISDGEAAGGTAVIALVPEKQLAVVTLTNATGGPALETAVAVLSALVPGFAEQFGEAVERIERELAAPGEAPAGHFEGALFDGADELAVRLDFSDAERPVMQLGESMYLLQGLSWEHGALQAIVVGTLPLGAGKGRTHQLVLTLWLRGNELRGIAQEDLLDDRPRSGTPHLLVLRSAP